MTILVFNSGSSSLKFSLFKPAAHEELQPIIRGSVSGFGPHSVCTWDDGATRTTSRIRIEHHAEAAHWVFTRLDQTLEGWETRLLGIGHRVVHGGDLFVAPVRITEAVLTDLAPLSDLAPPHNPAAVEIMRACQTRFGLLTPMIAVFDTAFFHDLPDAARHYAASRIAVYVIPVDEEALIARDVHLCLARDH